MDTRTGEGYRFAFIVRWLDPKTLLIWHYQLFYYTRDQSIEMFDIKNQRIFLKRVAHPEIHLEHLYIGASISLYSRQLIIESYGDEFTRKHLQGFQETTFALIKPDGIKNMGRIVDLIFANGFLIKELRMCKLSLQDAQMLYKAHAEKPFYGALTELMASGLCIAMELVAENAIRRWRALLGPTNSEEARDRDPNSIRALFGTNNTQNACHGSDSVENAKKESMFFFRDRNVGSCARLDNCTLCIIRPHLVFDGVAGQVIELIAKKFDITAMEMVTFSQPNAAEFLEIYKGILPDFHAMVHELASGPFIAMEICNKDGQGNPVNALREFCGPPDSQACRIVRPHTLRAKFGINKVKNGVHCTDLPEDGVLECKFIFKHSFNPFQEAMEYNNNNLR